jgi:hypothetical protein
MNTVAPSKKILVLTANPIGSDRLRLDKEVREIGEGLRRSARREQFQLEQRWAVRLQDLHRALLDVKPQIVHFSGHGAGEGGLMVEDEQGKAAFISTAMVQELFQLFADMGVECVVLNACYSEAQATVISQHIPFVVGMPDWVNDRLSIAFAVAFYDAIGDGQDYEFAFRLGAMQFADVPTDRKPVLKKGTELKRAPMTVASEIDRDLEQPKVEPSKVGINTEGGSVQIDTFTMN